MPSSDRLPDLLVDTSVAVALVVADHEQHLAIAAALEGRRLGLAGHAAFETFSVLTRLPPPNRRSASVVANLLASNFPATRFLSADGAARLFARLRDGNIAGGAIYDALVGAAATEHGLMLASSDRRALETYRALAVQVEYLPLESTDEVGGT